MAANLGVLGWFKYYGFFVTSVVNFLGALHLNADLPLLRIVLPLGISFLTFRVLSYVIDVYRGTLRPASLLDFSVYVAFFPYLAAGPIARASEFLPQLNGPRDPRSVDTARAFFLIFGGLIKKMLIADYLATHIVNGVFTTPGQYSSLEVSWASSGTRCRSTATSAPTPTSPSASRCCSASSCRTTSTRRTRPRRSRTSGAAGT